MRTTVQIDDELSLVEDAIQVGSQGSVWTQVIGHRQVNDAYLLSLAQKHKGKLATLDQAIPSLILDIDQREFSLELIE